MKWLKGLLHPRFFSACFEARPSNLKPHFWTNFQFYSTNVVSDFLGTRRNITLKFLLLGLLHPHLRYGSKPEGPNELVKRFVRGRAGPINILRDLGYFHLVDYFSSGSQVSFSNLG